MENTIFIFVVLTICSAFTSGVEIAYFSLSRGRVRSMVTNGLRWAGLVERLKQKPKKLLITILTANNLINIFATAIATQYALSVFGSNGVAIATGVVTFLILTFGEIIPKTFSQANAGLISRYSSPIVFVLEIILYPAVLFFKGVMNIFSFGSEKQSTKIAEDEIRSLFQIGVEEGTLEKNEKEFAERLFRFNDLLANVVMKSLQDVFVLDGKLNIEDALKIIIDSGYSRAPVFEGNSKNIVGIVHIKDVIKSDIDGHKTKDISGISKPIVSVDEYEILSDVFRLMIRKRTHFVVVRNNSGAPVGIVTFEDVIEELLGKIYDETD